MHSILRRHFLGRTAIALTGTTFLSPGTWRLNANPLNMHIGFQAYDPRKALIKDFDALGGRLQGTDFKLSI
jgi:hypothetical protein